jgi:hypothetical protein
MLFLAVILSVPCLAYSDVYWEEDFEALDFSLTEGFGPWLIFGGVPERIQPQRGKIDIVRGGCYSGSRCLRLHYTDLSAGEGPFANRTHPKTTHLYTRYWVKMSKDFLVSPMATKLGYWPRGTGDPSCLMMLNGGTRPYFNCQTTTSPSGGYSAGVFDPNFSGHPSGPSIDDGRWHCIETEVDMGTPRVRNGTMRYWLDDNLVGELTNLLLNTSPQYFEDVRFYRERGLGDVFFDLVAVGPARIGCVGGVPPVDERPSAPANVQVQLTR